MGEEEVETRCVDSSFKSFAENRLRKIEWHWKTQAQDKFYFVLYMMRYSTVCL